MFGAGADVPLEWRESAQASGDDCEVMAEEWPVVQAWIRVQTQWRTSFGGLVGLDYTAVLATLDRLKIADPDGEIFEGIQLMEFAALEALSEQQ